MQPEQNDAGLFERNPALDGNLKFSSARSRIYAGIGYALYSWAKWLAYARQARMPSRVNPG